MLNEIYRAANEIFSWAETPSGALIFYPALALITLGACYCGYRIKNWYKRKYGKPERKPFEGIPTQRLPKSEL